MMNVLALILIIFGIIAATFLLWLLFNCEALCKCFTNTSNSNAREDVELGNQLHPIPPQASLSSKEEVNSQILIFQENLRSDCDEVKERKIRNVQNLLISYKYFFQENNELIQNSLIIGVDARPTTMGGYCINSFDRSLHFYTIKKDDFPWLLLEEHTSAEYTAEFEMKNLMFALTIWRNQIVSSGRFFLYTDNFAMNKAFASRYGAIAKEYVNHIVNCDGITVLNQGREAVNKNRDLKAFSKYIQPADDLSRWKINTAKSFLSQLYSIDNKRIQGTHVQRLTRRNGVTISSISSEPHYDTTAYYNRILDSAYEVISTGLPCQNPACNSFLRLSVKRRN